jgi:hypothetical protein
MRHTRVALAVPLVIVALLTGCADKQSTSASSSNVVSPPDAQAGIPTAPPTPTAPPGTTVQVKDAQGYTLDVTYVYRPLTPVKDISGEPPGFNSIRIPLQASWTITNTTNGRDITFGRFSGAFVDPTMALVGLWPSESNVCTYRLDPSVKGVPGSFCSIYLSYTKLPQTLSASQTVTPPAFAGYLGSDAGAAHVPDAKYDAVLAELKSPAALSIVYSGSDMVRFKDSCPDPDLAEYLKGQWAISDMTYAFFNNGFLPIASTTTPCSKSELVLQPVAR